MYLKKNLPKMWLLPLALVLVMIGCTDRVGVTYPPAADPPTVSTASPVDQSTGVALNEPITVVFNEVMDSLTITTATFTLAQGTSFISGTVFYTGTTATFIPSGNLLPNTVYTATVTTMVKNLAGTSLAASYSWSFTTGLAGTISHPTVSSTDPINAATGVPINRKIAADFSNVMNASTISTSSFTLMHGTTSVAGVVSYSGTEATFAPSVELLPNTAYTATITTGVKNLAGNAMAHNYEWSFTTGATAVTTPPTVISTDPLNAAVGVPLNKRISATFSDGMNSTTITTTTFMLKLAANVIPGEILYSHGTAIFSPITNLTANTTYTATITTGVEDLAGNSLASNYSWSFTTSSATDATPPTVISTSPVNVTTGVALEKRIEANFSEAMNASTITTETFTLMQGSTIILGVVSYSGTKAVFTPRNSLAPNSTYSAAITVGTEDLAGNAMVANYLWSFTTRSALAAADQPPVVLESAGQFAILSSSAITNIPTSSITGDVGISPGVRSDISGLTNPEVTGTIYAADDADPVPADLTAAKNDAEAAYLDAVAATRGTPTPISGNINGLTLVPGLYESGTSIEISPGGFLYLDAQGDANGIFVLRSATSITTESTSEVVLTNNAQAKNIYWVSGSAVTLGTNSIMKGTVIASTSISMLTGATLEGRVLIQGAAAGQVSLDQCTIVLPE